MIDTGNEAVRAAQAAITTAMSEHTADTVDGTEGNDRTVTDPEALAERNGIAFEHRTYNHDDAEHCETDTAGRAIVGLTDPDGRVLVAVQPEEDHAVLPNETVEPDGDWTAAGRERVEGTAGVSVTLDDVRRVREVEHHVDGEIRSTTHHVVFGGSLADADTTLDGLCDDDPWKLRWFDAMPTWLDDEARGVYADIELFVGENE